MFTVLMILRKSIVDIHFFNLISVDFIEPIVYVEIKNRVPNMCFIKSNLISLILKYLLRGRSHQVITSVFFRRVDI